MRSTQYGGTCGGQYIPPYWRGRVAGGAPRRRGESEPPFLLEVAHFATPSHRAGVGLQSHLGPFGEFLGVADQTGDERAIGAEDLHAVVGPVAHIHIAI